MRILHLADLHLDRPFPALPPDAAARRRAGLRAALRRCLALAGERQADAVTIGGDLWEDAHVTAQTRRGVARELRALAPMPVLVVAGNHDPRVARGAEGAGWPANVRVFPGGELGEVRLGDVSVWGTSWTPTALERAFLGGFRAPSDGRSHVLLLHAAPRGFPQALAGRGAWGEVDPLAVERCGFRLCLGGHLHQGLRLGPLVYPGSPEPLGWTGRGRHGCAVVDVDAGAAVVELVATATVRNLAVVVDATGAADPAELVARIAARLPPPGPEVYARIRLVGAAAFPVDPGALIAPLAAGFGGLVARDATQPGSRRSRAAAGAAAGG